MWADTRHIDKRFKHNTSPISKFVIHKHAKSSQVQELAPVKQVYGREHCWLGEKDDKNILSI